jgi:hypothetical protein
MCETLTSATESRVLSSVGARDTGCIDPVGWTYATTAPVVPGVPIPWVGVMAAEWRIPLNEFQGVRRIRSCSSRCQNLDRFTLCDWQLVTVGDRTGSLSGVWVRLRHVDTQMTSRLWNTATVKIKTFWNGGPMVPVRRNFRCCPRRLSRRRGGYLRLMEMLRRVPDRQDIGDYVT